MDDFFKTIYDHAVEFDTLNHEHNQEYRIALADLHELAETLIPDIKSQNKLLDTVYGLLYASDLDALTYGFRLAIRVTNPIY